MNKRLKKIKKRQKKIKEFRRYKDKLKIINRRNEKIVFMQSKIKNKDIDSKLSLIEDQTIELPQEEDDDRNMPDVFEKGNWDTI